MHIDWASKRARHEKEPAMNTTISETPTETTTTETAGFVAVDANNLVWGAGDTPEAAEADAAVWLSECPRGPGTPLETHAVSAEQLARVVEDGETRWPLV